MKKIFILSVLGIFAVQMVAFAHWVPGGGRWNLDYIVFCDESSYRSYTADAVARWNNKKTAVGGAWPNFARADCLDPHNALAYDIEDPNGAYAYGIPGPYGGPFVSAELQYNIARIGELSDSEKQYMALHELGHILGLGHNKLIYPSVMSQVAWWNGIYAHDENDLNQLYPRQ